MTLREFLKKNNVIIDSTTSVEYRLIDDADYDSWKDSDFFPGFTSDKVEIVESSEFVSRVEKNNDNKTQVSIFDVGNHLRITAEFDDDGKTEITISLDREGTECDDGFVANVCGENVKLVFLHQF